MLLGIHKTLRGPHQNLTYISFLCPNNPEKNQLHLIHKGESYAQRLMRSNSLASSKVHPCCTDSNASLSVSPTVLQCNTLQGHNCSKS